MSPALRFCSVSFMSALLLSGCQSMKSFEWPQMGANKAAVKSDCPATSISPDLGNMVQLRGSQVVSETIIADIKPSCETKQNMVAARLAIDFKSRLGPVGIKEAAKEANYTLPYLIALVNSQNQIVSKEIFAISLTYKAGQTEQAVSDLIEQTIPLQKGEKASDYKIMIGFQLSPEELAFNRQVAATNLQK